MDVLVRSGRSSFGDRLALPHVPGVDAAGVVDEVGADVTVAVGDEVFGAVDVARLGGTSAEFAVLAFWTAKPASLSWEEAGGAENHDFIAGLGAAPAAYDERVRDVDLVLDVAGRGSLPDLVSLTGSATSVVTLSDFTGPKIGVRLSTGTLGGEPHGRHGLAVAAALAEEGRFRVPLREVFPFARADRAHALVADGPRRGKVVLTAPR